MFVPIKEHQTIIVTFSKVCHINQHESIFIDCSIPCDWSLINIVCSILKYSQFSNISNPISIKVNLTLHIIYIEYSHNSTVYRLTDFPVKLVSCKLLFLTII